MDFLKTKNFNITSYLAIAALVLNVILPVIASAGGFSFCDMMKPDSNKEIHHSSSEMSMNNKNEDCHGMEREA
ncbi:MAG: hypothetical protein MI700_13720, partial [Balneolales bacterium]|nr:hypothetical protein [Balneolales bacterium]